MNYRDTTKVQPTPDSKPLYSNAVHTPEMWEKIGEFLVKQGYTKDDTYTFRVKTKVEAIRKWVGSSGTC